MNIKCFTIALATFASGLFHIAPSQAQYKQTTSNEAMLLNNAQNLIPLKNLDQHKIAVVTPFPNKYKAFIDGLSRYADVASFDFNQYDEQTKYFNTIIVAGTDDDLRNDVLLKATQSLVNKKTVIVVRFGRDSGRAPWTQVSSSNQGIVLRYPTFNQTAQQYAAMSIFGGMAITAGDNKTEQTRLQYTQGEGAGLNVKRMASKIEGIAKEAIQQRATPGLVVMVVKNGQVIFEKAYGTHTYDKKQETKVTDIFDLASVSKIAGTTPVIMHLQERGLINLDSTMGYYLWQAKASNKKDIPLRSVLLHEAGFTPFIPFYKNLKKGDLQRTEDSRHQVKVADSAYLLNNYYSDIMWPQMLQSAVKPIGSYVYSDISMYVMKEVAEHITAMPMDAYVQQLLYKPIGMKTAGYNPRQRFSKSSIVPTEHDTAFRKVLLQGYVHDQGAAMAGGVAGHAGLFASANDLAIYGQLLLNRGQYGGVRFFKPETVDLFTSKQSLTSRRGLGFDRYDPDVKKGYPSKLANSSVFGHTGYTGTCIWIDPQNQLVYIFLSNRVHPQVSDKLLNLNIRSRIQDAIYETINEAK
ncbi:serine hydrolase domain-containing protein [Sphingobacterium paludis]|uniref:CubicO group peptidase (Beta-lactamase class C family) n=1 Tax=Sphingobacterium paludis TaxID=1476465 RepID=A0A4R7D1N9_9SPHI|nr:serine hydrolase [Sphingobacterium paludis]TDS14650.1 CubicO group peptidase (beta-lactamase class C family) [Sphingobacterium paludis]